MKKKNNHMGMRIREGLRNNGMRNDGWMDVIGEWHEGIKQTKRMEGYGWVILTVQSFTHLLLGFRF